MKSKILVLTFGNIPASPTGLATSVIRRSKVLAEQNIETEILGEEFDINFNDNIKQLREKGEILDNTKVRNMYAELGEDYSDDRESIDIVQHFKNLGYILIRDEERSNVLRGYKDGLYEIFIWLDNNNKVNFIDYLQPDFTRTKREWYDNKGYLRKIDYMNIDNKPIRQVYINQNNHAYLSILLEAKSQKIKQIIHFSTCGDVKIFTSKSEMLKYWLETKVMDKSRTNILISEYGFNYSILKELENKIKLKVIYTLHNNHFTSPYTYGSDIRPELKTFFNKIRDIENLVVLTKEQKNDLEMQFAIKDSINVIPHHVPRCKVDTKRDELKVVMVGRFEKVKGMKDGIIAFKDVVKELPDAKLELYGRGSCEEEYKKIIKENKLDDSVTIKGFTNSVYNIFSEARVSLVPSQYEGICLSMMESMACGCIPIAYDFKYGPNDIIKNFENGIITEKGNTKALSDAIIKLLKDKELSNRLSYNASKIVDDFSEKRLYNDWMNLLTRIDESF